MREAGEAFGAVDSERANQVAAATAMPGGSPQTIPDPAEVTVTTMLIFSLSPLAGDARVLKQIRHFAAEYQVTTCGYGPSPDPRVEHIEVPRASEGLDGRLITAHAYAAAYRRIPAIRAARAALAGRGPGKRGFDVAIADDIQAAPVVYDLVDPRHVLLDLHEYSPLLNEEHPAWKRRIGPYYAWLVRKYAPRAGAVTTVGRGLAAQYERVFGVHAQVVTNAAPYAELPVGPVGEVIRLVHSGACLRNRRLDLLVDAVARARVPVTLDLFLTANDPGFLAELRARAAAPGSAVTVHDPVPYPELVATLNGYDVGVHVLPPVNFNNRNALPNKIFDYVQARLALLVGPTPEMAQMVQDFDLGVVTSDFTAAALADALDTLTPDRVAGYKAASARAARELSAQSQISIWDRLVRGLTGLAGSG